MHNNDNRKKNVSYSQLSMYSECPYKWYLNYIKKLGSYESNIHLIFGNAMHRVLQSYLTVMYASTVKEADSIDLNSELYKALCENFVEEFKNSGKHVCTKEQIVEFYNDGVNILQYFKKHRDEYFSKKGYLLVGIEVPLMIDLPKNITFAGYLDIVIKDEISGKIKIIDFKTSTMGWRDYQKKDENKVSQIILYKKFYSDKFDVQQDLIDVEFIILKRKLYENVDFPQKRIQRFTPASGKTSVNQTIKRLNNFIDECFTDGGEHNTQRIYQKCQDGKACKFCEYSKDPAICGGFENKLMI